MAYDAYGRLIPGTINRGNNESALDLKLNRLAQNRQEKLDRLGYGGGGYNVEDTRNKNLLDGRMQQEDGVSGGSGYTMTENGPVANKNLIHNDYTQDEMGQFESDLYDQSHFVDEDGYKYLQNTDGSRAYLEDQNADSSYRYRGFSKDGSETKGGVGKYGVIPRYNKGMAARQGLTNNEKYGWPSGPEGIDAANAPVNWPMPRGMAEKAENIDLGNSANMLNKAVYDDGSLDSILARRARGGGTSEYQKYVEGRPIYGGVDKPGGTRSIFDEQGFVRQKTVDSRENVKYKPLALMTEYEKLGYGLDKRKENYVANERDGYGGQLVDLAQASLARTGAGAIDAGATGIGRLLGNEKEWENVQIPFLDKKINKYKDIDYMDKEFGVDIRKRDKSNQDNSAAAGSVKRAFQDPSLENIVGAIKGVGTIAANFPETLAASAGEILSFAHPALFTAMIAGRVNTDRETFMKNNPGKEWTAAEEAGSFISNYGVMKIEKLFFGMLGKSASSTLLNPIKKKLIGAITTGAIQVLKSAGMEGAQEYLDQAQQDLMTMAQTDTDFQDRVQKALTSDEAIEGAIIGFGSGGGVAAVSPAVGAVKRLPGDVNTMREKMARSKGLASIDEHLDDVDNDFAKMKLDASSEVAKEYIAKADEAREIVKTAKSSSNDTFAELEKSDNEYVKNFVTAVKTKFVDNNLEDVAEDNQALMDNTIANAIIPGEKSTALLKKLKIDEATFNAKDIKGKKDMVVASMKSRPIIDSLIKGLDDVAKAKVYDTSFDAGSKAKATKGMTNQFERSTMAVRQSSEADIATFEASKKKLNRTTSAPKIGGEVDTSTLKLDAKPAWGNIIKTLFGKNNKQNAIKELGRYTTEALETKAKTATPQLKSLIEKTLKKRSEAKAYAGLDTNTNTQSGQYNEVKKNEELGKNKHSTMAKAKTMFQVTHYRNQEEVVNAADYINRAVKAGHFTEAQAKILKGRLNKIKLRTESIKAKEELESRESIGNAKTHFENVNKGTEKSQNEDGKPRLYRFRSTGPNGRPIYHEGKITFDDRNTGMVHVDFVDENGETQQLIFGRSKGNQVYVTNQKNQYFNGEEFERDVDENVDEDIDDTEDTTEKVDNPDGTGDNDPSSEAARRANLGVFANQMDIENMTDQELKDMINDEDLKAIFGC